MRVHTLFVEPANYTVDLIENVHRKLGISYSFFNSNSLAAIDNKIVFTAKHLFDRNSFLKNLSFLWRCSKDFDLVIVNGYNHIYFIFIWVFSLINSCSIGIESDTPYHPTFGIKGVIKTIYLNLIFSNKLTIGLPGGTGLHRCLFKNYGMHENRIFFLPMMVNNQKYFNKKPLDLAIGKPLKFIYVGRFVPEKNISLLIHAFQEVLKRGKLAELEIVGSGECESELKEMIVISPEIKILGKKFGLDLLQAYEKAQSLILPSNFEPWGLVVNEAMAAGLPVICSTAVGSAKDLVLKPSAGWVFKNNDKRELVNLLINIIDNPLKLKEKSKIGQNFMLNYWNYDLYVKSLKVLFDYVSKT